MKNISQIIFDMDGVLYLGKKRIDSAHIAISNLIACGLDVSFITNNSTLSRDCVINKLRKFKIYASKSQVMCSSYATAQYVSKYQNKNTPATAYVIGETGLKKELEIANIRVLSEKECEKNLADFLIVGLDRKFSYKKIEIAQKHILANKNFIVTNDDSQYPSHNGIKPGAGSMVASVCFAGTPNSSSKIKSYDFIVGKPNTYMLKLLLGSKSAKNCVLVGDRLDSDIALAKKMKMHSILVLSGVTKKEHLKKSKIKPDAVLNSVRDLPKYLSLNSLFK